MKAALLESVGTVRIIDVDAPEHEEAKPFVTAVLPLAVSESGRATCRPTGLRRDQRRDRFTAGLTKGSE
jgi:hypothetical protein